MRRFLAKILIGVTLSIITLLLFCFIFLQNEHVKDYALKYATDHIHAKTGWNIKFQKIQGLLPLQLRGTGLKILSPDQQEYSVESFHLVISPYDLFKGQINIHLADLEHIKIDLPFASAIDSKIDFEELKEFKSPILPIKIKIHEFRLTDLDLGTKFPNLDVEGSFEFHPFKQKLFAQINFKEALQEQAFTKFSIAVHKNLDLVNANVSLLEPENGLLSTYFHLPVALSTGVSINLVGTPIAWDHLINKKKGAEDVSGDFDLRCCWNKDNPHKLSTSGVFKFFGNRSIQLTRLQAQLHHDGKPEQPLLTVEGSFHLDDMHSIVGSDFIVQAHELSFSKYILGNPVEGNAQAKLQATGHILKPKISLELSCDDLTIQGYTSRHLHSLTDLIFTENAFEGSTKVTFNLKEMPFSIASNFSWDMKNLIKMPILNISFPETVISAELEYQLQEKLANGTVEIHAKDITNIASLLNQKASGTLDIQFHLHPEYVTEIGSFVQAADLVLSGTKLTSNEIDIGQLFAKQKFSFAEKHFKSQMTLSAKGVNVFPLPLTEINFSTVIDSSATNWPYEFAVNGDGNHLLTLSSIGSWHNNLLDSSTDNFTLKIDTLQGSLEEYALLLQQPITFSRAPHVIELSPVIVQLGDGNLFASIDYTPQHMVLNWDVRQIPLQILRLINPNFLLTGSFNSEAKLYGDPSQLLGDMQFNLHEIKVDDTILKMPTVEATFKTELQHGRLKASGNIFGIGTKPITLIGEIPFSLSLDPLIAVMDLEEPISAHVELQGEIAPILQLMIADTTSITGNAMSTLDVSGNLGNPQISGQIELRDGSFESLGSGAVLKNIYVKIQGEGHEFRIIEAHAEDGNEGTLQASGMVLLDPSQKFPFDFTYDFNKTTILHLDYAHAIASGKLNWKGTVGNDILSGDLTLDNATVRIPEEIPAQMHALEVTYINHPPHEKEPSYHRKKKTRPITLDIKLHIPSNFSVTGKNLSSEWKGLIAITGTDEKPLLNGGLEVMQGKYQFNGKDFELHQGTITFAGDPANKSSLYVTADQETEGMKLEAILKGPIKNPKISFRSNPPMSQKEILSWILFNRGANEITSSENAQLSQSIITLSSGNSGPDLLSKIRRSFGIDRIDISSKDTNDSSEVSLRVGKYISRGIFLSVNKSINSETNQVAIEANITRNIKAQAEINDDAKGKMILKWQKDY